MVNNFEELKKEVEKLNKGRSRSAWGRGVAEYTFELLDNIQNHEQEASTFDELWAQMLNGADSWRQYSWGGCSLIYDCDICERLATKSEQKRKKGGELAPNSWETWLDTQTRALNQAAYRVKAAYRVIKR